MITFAICLVGALAFDKCITLPHGIFELVKIFAIFVLCMVVYIPLNLVMKMDYANELANRIKARLIK